MFDLPLGVSEACDDGVDLPLRRLWAHASLLWESRSAAGLKVRGRRAFVASRHDARLPTVRSATKHGALQRQAETQRSAFSS
jgi:hypothetical protein